MRTRTGYIAVVRSLLRQHGWHVRTGGAETFSYRVRELPMPGRVLSEIAPLLAVMRHVNQQLAYPDERIETITEGPRDGSGRVRLVGLEDAVGEKRVAAWSLLHGAKVAPAAATPR